jgi:D-glycero-alpha-D-manno-heptose-7-phosphate kinase
LAQEACRIEIDILGKPIGRQDQYAAAYGGMNQFTFGKDDGTLRTAVKIPSLIKRKFAASLLLYFTGLTRSADDILSHQRQGMNDSEKRKILEQMVSLVDPFTLAIQRDDLESCARLLDTNWQLKQQLARGISNPDIDEMYGRAKRAGALAGKISGAGGGGFLLLLARREDQNKIFQAMSDYRELPFMLEDGGSKIIFDDRSYSSK